MNIEINFLKNFIILASGGNLQKFERISKYCDGVITSAVYHAKSANLEVKIF